MFFRLHGSVLPHLIIPIVLVSTWAAVVCISLLDKEGNPRNPHRKPDPRITFLKLTQYPPLDQWDSTMLTVLGFLVGIGLSLRNSTAYERYSEGRRYWSNLTLQTTNLARLIWVNVKERDGDQGKEDLLGKMYEIC
jgi:ion channel-forming bestrophin family protein